MDVERFRKKPIVIEAYEYAGRGNGHPRYKGNVPSWVSDGFESGVLRATNGTDPLVVVTAEGEMVLSSGDWLIRGVEGELYPCKPSVFAATYEPVEGEGR